MEFNTRLEAAPRQREFHVLADAVLRATEIGDVSYGTQVYG